MHRANVRLLMVVCGACCACSLAILNRLLGSSVLLALQVQSCPTWLVLFQGLASGRGASFSGSCAALFQTPVFLVTSGVSGLLGVVVAMSLSSCSCRA